MRLRGVAHVHSRYSFDGRHLLAEVVQFLRGQGLDFVLMSEHTKQLSDADMARFVAECRVLSDDQFLVVPGIECEATPDYVHILGYNVRTVIRSRDAVEIARGIREHGGYAALAHPAWREAFRHLPAPALDLLNGWEVWNGKADGRWFPSTESIRRLAELRVSRAGLLPLAGVDLHRLEAYPEITLEVDCAAPTGQSLLAALGAGAFTGRGASFQFSPRGRLEVPARSLALAASIAVYRFKRCIERLDRRLAKRGLQAPQPLYRLARRLLR